MKPPTAAAGDFSVADSTLSVKELKALCEVIGTGGVQLIQSQLLNFVVANVS
jgi:hypothetical protein